MSRSDLIRISRSALTFECEPRLASAPDVIANVEFRFGLLLITM